VSVLLGNRGCAFEQPSPGNAIIVLPDNLERAPGRPEIPPSNVKSIRPGRAGARARRRHGPPSPQKLDKITIKIRTPTTTAGNKEHPLLRTHKINLLGKKTLRRLTQDS